MTAVSFSTNEYTFLLAVHNAMKILDIVKYFSETGLEESLLRRLLFSPKRNVVELVFDYAAPAVSTYFIELQQGISSDQFSIPPKDFRYLKFENVTDFQFKYPGPLDWELLEKYLFKKPVTITGVKILKKKEQFHIELFLCDNRKCIFSFGELLEKRKLATGREIARNKW